MEMENVKRFKNERKCVWTGFEVDDFRVWDGRQKWFMWPSSQPSHFRIGATRRANDH